MPDKTISHTVAGKSFADLFLQAEEGFDQGAFACPVLAYNAEIVALFHFEIQIGGNGFTVVSER